MLAYHLLKSIQESAKEELGDTLEPRRSHESPPTESAVPPISESEDWRRALAPYVESGEGRGRPVGHDRIQEVLELGWAAATCWFWVAFSSIERQSEVRGCSHPCYLWIPG